MAVCMTNAAASGGACCAESADCMSWEIPERPGSFECIPAAAIDREAFTYWLALFLECAEDIRRGFMAHCDWVCPPSLPCMCAAPASTSLHPSA